MPRSRALNLGGALLRASCPTRTPPCSLVASEERKHFENWSTPRSLEKALEKDSYECNRPKLLPILRTLIFKKDSLNELLVDPIFDPIFLEYQAVDLEYELIAERNEMRWGTFETECNGTVGL